MTKRKRTRNTSSSSPSASRRRRADEYDYEEGEDDDYGNARSRSTRRRVNYAESSDFLNEDDDDEEEEEEPEVEHSDNEDNDAEEEEQHSDDNANGKSNADSDSENDNMASGANGRSLHVRLRLRSSRRLAGISAAPSSDANAVGGSVGAKDDGDDDHNHDHVDDQDDDDDDKDDEEAESYSRTARRQSKSSSKNRLNKSKSPPLHTRRLSATSIRQQLLQQKAQPFPRQSARKTTSSSRRDRHGGGEEGGDDDEEFHLDPSSESAEEHNADSESSEEPTAMKGFVVEDSDFEEGNSRRRSTRRSSRLNARQSSQRNSKKSNNNRRRRDDNDDDDDDDDGDDDDDDDDDVDDDGGGLTIDQELADLSPPPASRRKNLRARRQVNYQILPPPPIESYDDFLAPSSPRRRHNTGSRRLYSTSGPFGGAGVKSLFGSRPRDVLQAAGGAADLDSSDDEAGAKNAANKMPNLGDIEQMTNPAGSLGLVKKSSLSDTDPLGVDMNIDFSAVGGLDDHINQLKEMVALPLMYPEVFQRFKVTPPRGVLFHGPPGTGKTLVARALAASCSTEHRKISFYMRKGADALSKWVGEAERQLRLLFEEARNTQPSIIFFDEIDGLAPVRSSKQEQIHASIVSTLLALMDGMDNRGQVIVIGATNRPDSIDPALRRPGRFDREFYFPLPNADARKKIIDIHTKEWDPPLDPSFISHIARLTKGYGGADLRALCTESALSAIQRRYPQIYNSDEKLVIDPSSITVAPRDFIMSLKKIIPSSQRSTASNAAPLPDRIEPLLAPVLEKIKAALDHLIPRQRKLTIAEEAMYEEDISDRGFAREKMMEDFESSRVFRPRLLISGAPGMGQEYLGAAAMQYLEGYHVQNFDLATLLGDPTRTVEAAVVQLFVEVRRHTPGVVYIPNVDSWYHTLSPSAWTTFKGLLRGISPVEQILVLGVVEQSYDFLDHEIKSLFGFSQANRIEILKSSFDERFKFFSGIMDHIAKEPSEYPDKENRKRRELEILPKAPPPPPRQPSKAELKSQEEKDKRLKNYLKIKLSGLMDLLKARYKRFRKPPIDEEYLLHLFDGAPQEPQVEYEYSLVDNEMILQHRTGKKYHNMDLDVIEDRLWNGYYCLPKQFLQDVAWILEDANTSGDREKILKASEMFANVQVSVDEIGDAQFLLDCERMFEREKQRSKVYDAKLQRQLEKQREIQAMLQLQHEATPAAATEAAETTTTESRVVPIDSLFDDDIVEPTENGHKALPNGNVEHGVEDAMKVDVPDSQPLAEEAVVPTPLPVTRESETSASTSDAGAPSVMSILAITETASAAITTAVALPAEAPPISTAPLATTESASLTIATTESAPDVTEIEQPLKSTGVEHPPYELDMEALTAFHENLTNSTDGFAIEQLEQLNSALSDGAYRCRLNWNRNEVLRTVGQVASEVIPDIRQMVAE
ncbi:uncharacterized protein V1518DRAFT_428978 [Limtongia smithiae]|uniref:uncharacterized protein n=1 Tax=Limtongia smithiae TaxID=1125753 RepID=UPI0034CFE689